ncbi:hypothetical protein D3C74_505520 [compost metagenome]
MPVGFIFRNSVLLHLLDVIIGITADVPDSYLGFLTEFLGEFHQLGAAFFGQRRDG